MKQIDNKLKHRLVLLVGIAALLVGIGTNRTMGIRGAEIDTSKEVNPANKVKNELLLTGVSEPASTNLVRQFPLVSNEDGLSATPKIVTMQQNAAFPSAGSSQTELNKLITGLVIPAPNNGVVWDYVTEFGEAFIPSSAELGFQTVYIEITELSNLTTIRLAIPVTVMNSDTTLLLSNSVALQVDMTSAKTILYPNETVGKTDDELKELIKTKSNARAWDLSNGEALATTVSATTTKNNSVGSYTATFNVDFDGVIGTATKNVLVFGANLRAPSYFTANQGVTFNMGANAATVFGSYQTLNNTTAANATYEWVTSDGEGTTPVNTFNTSQSGFHWGYIKMTENSNTQISTIIPIPITVTAEGQTVILNDKAGVSFQSPILSASDVREKTVPKIINVLTEKLNLKAWQLATGQELTARVTGSSITQVSRGAVDVTVSVAMGEETLSYVLKVFVLPDEVFGSEGATEWNNVPFGSEQGTITNPINGSKLGFPGRGIQPSSTRDGFIIRDANGQGYVFGAGNGRVADIPGVGSRPLYGSWGREAGIGREVRPQLTAKSYLRKGDSLKQILIDQSNQIAYVYDLNIARNLNFSIELKMFNLQSGTRNFSMLESVDTDYYSDVVPIYALGNNSGFYMEPTPGTRFTIRLKDYRGNWLSDYTKYIAGSYYTIGVQAGTNYFGNDFSGVGTESQNLSLNALIAVAGTDTAYQLGAPWKAIPQDGALKTGYQVSVGAEIPYMQLKADPGAWNIYQDNSDSNFETDYTLSQIPTATDFGTVYATYPNGQEATMPFTANASKEAYGRLTIPRTTLPDVLNDDQGTVKKYTTNMITINEAEGQMNGLPSNDYAVNINVYNMGATAVAQTVRKDTVWNKAASSLVKDPVILPGHTPIYEYVKETPIDTSKVGLQYAEVRMTDGDDSSQSKVIMVPVNVINGTVPTTGLTVAANNFKVNTSDLIGVSADEIKALILTKSKAAGWDNTTGLSVGVTLSVTQTTLTAASIPGTTYTATIQAAKAGVTRTTPISIEVGTDLSATAVSQSLILGTDTNYWTAAKLKATVKDVMMGSDAFANYTVELDTEPVTNRITTGSTTTPMIVKVTNTDDPSQTAVVEVPVRVTWGNSLAIGGSNTVVGAPNGQSTLALTLHVDGSGNPYLQSSFGNLPKASETTPLLASAGTEAYYQITHLNLTGQATGKANAREVSDGPDNSGVTLEALGNNTPAQMVNQWGTNGKLSLNYGDVIKVYAKQAQRALYTDGNGPTRPLEGLPNDDTAFVLVTENGFVPLYFNHLDGKNVSIESSLTATTAGYDNQYTSIGAFFTVPTNASPTDYTRIDPAGYKSYPKLDLAVGEESTGSVYVTEPTSPTSNKFLKYAYNLTFVGSGPELQIVEPIAPLSFGTTTLKSQTQVIKRTDPNWSFTVLDSRAVKDAWVIQAKVENPFQTGSSGDIKELRGAALQVKQGVDTLTLNENFATIYAKETPDPSNNIGWAANEGFELLVPPGAIEKDATYTTRIDFILTNAPTK